MKTFQKIVSVVCTLAVIVTMTSQIYIGQTFARAEEIQPDANETAGLPVALEENEKFMSGNIGKNVTYELYNNGNLVISGEGKTNEYSYNRITMSCNTPWYIYHRSKIRSVFVSDNVTRIGNYLFNNCNNLEEVYISDGVTEIGDSVFGGCRKLTTISIPDSVVDIGENAFDCCRSLVNVVLPNGLSQISDNMFVYCDSLTSVTIPESVTSIGIQAFYGCDELKDVFFSGTKEQWNKISIASNNGALKKATIHYNCATPNTLEDETNPMSGKCGDNLTWTLNDNGFLTISGTGEMYDYDYSKPSPWNGSDVVSVNINNGVTSIGNYAFGMSHGFISNCKEVFVPKSLKRIGNNAFGLATYTDIFYSGSKEEWNSISKPEMGDRTLLESICHFNYDSSHEDRGISGTCGAHLSWTLDDNDTLTISGTGKMYDFGLETAPWWKSVHNSVFNKSISFKTVTIENGVSSIGANAFQYCEDIKSISLPESLVTIEGGAFLGCKGLTSIFIPKGTTKIEAYFGRSGGVWGTLAVVVL